MSKATDLHERLQAEAAAMREALEVVMWAELEETGTEYCQWCAVSPGEKHLSDCQGYNALAADAGRELLERLQRAERERDEAQERIKQLKREIPARTFDIEDYQEVY